MKNPFMRINKTSVQKPAWFLLLVAALSLAADTFEPNYQPYGYQAPIALSKNNVKDGTALAFVPWFDAENHSGELLAAPVSAAGVVDYLAPIWRASQTVDAMDWNLGRRIITKNDDTGLAVPFRYLSISKDQREKDLLEDETLLNYLRGDQSGEAEAGFRPRTRLLGDIIHSNPVYVGKPLRGYLFNNYLTFAAANRNRSGRIYVGANDGMVHAFNVATGAEEFAYIPSNLIPKLPKLAANPYVHEYFVDGPITAEDAYFDGAWHTVLVGGQGAGGMGLYALDVTSPVVASELDATSRLMWEFTADDSDRLGYTYSRPSVVQLNDGRWAVIVGNGYMSKDGKAVLFIINLSDGSLIKTIEVKDSDDNGLSSPAVIDTNGDFKADIVYAGDLNGNLWKFDISSLDSGDWDTVYGDDPLFMTEYDDSTKWRQPITSAPTVGLHPEGGYFVYVATGSLLSAADAEGDYAVSPQSVYGVWDNNSDGFDIPYETTDFLQQNLLVKTHPSVTESVFTATSNTPDWTLHKGWATRLDASGANPGLRVITDHTLRTGRVQFTAVDPTVGSGQNYLMQLNAYTGGAPQSTGIDVNGDGAINVSDNVDGDDSGSVEDTAADRVAGKYLGYGMASPPAIAMIGSNDAAIVNQIYTASSSDNPIGEPPSDGEEETGLLGGHIDVDTSSEIYDFDDGATDNHVHEWDNKHDSTVVNFFDLIDDGFANIDEADMEPALSDHIFIVNVANAHLSPGGVIEINGVGVPVMEYRAKIKRYLNGNLGESESFPRYKLTPPTAAEAAAGIVQLTDMRMTFEKAGLLLGGVHPTATGCVKGNEIGQNGEYRNGALTIQALDATSVTGGHTLNPVNEAYETVSHAIHKLGYPVSRVGTNDGSLFWETTIFWHWGGGCYGPDKADDYNANFAELVTDVPRWTDDDISGDPLPEPEPEDEEEETTEEETSPPPTTAVSTTEIAGSSSGRLSWRELMVDE
ncbi:MAG: hypothetical protein KJO46_03330 [Gammaproteobacteria bacterium]|nr:hypothetical protein [Gammaproteobacteria bacterium]